MSEENVENVDENTVPDPAPITAGADEPPTLEENDGQVTVGQPQEPGDPTNGPGTDSLQDDMIEDDPSEQPQYDGVIEVIDGTNNSPQKNND